MEGSRVYGCFQNTGGPPKSSILIGFSIINHPFWGTPIFWKHPYIIYPIHVAFDDWTYDGYHSPRLVLDLWFIVTREDHHENYDTSWYIMTHFSMNHVLYPHLIECLNGRFPLVLPLWSTVHRMAQCHLAPSPWRNMGLKVGQLCGTSNLY